MNKFTTGIIAGGVLGAVGIAAVMSDDKNRKKVQREGKKALRKAGDMVENVTDMF